MDNNLLPEGRRSTSGFTIIELLIVVVVVAILAAITIVAYGGIQARARDSKMRNAASDIVKAIQLLSVDSTQSSSVVSGSGYGSTAPVNNGVCSGGGGGFIGTGYYSCSLEDMLVSTKLLPVSFVSSLPPNKFYANNSGHSMMYYPCGASGRALLLYYLESPTPDDSANLNANLATCGVGAVTRDSWGMRASIIISL